MEEKELLKLIREYNAKVEKLIFKAIGRTSDDAVFLQEKLINLLLAEFVGKLKVEGGLVVNSVDNLKIVNEIDNVFNQFTQLFFKDRLRRFAGDLLEVSKLSIEYFDLLGYGTETAKEIEKALELTEGFIGIKNNKLVKGGYLEALGQSHEVRLKLKNYVLNSISSKKGYRFFVKGFKNLVVGNKQTDGFLQRYYRVYAYDKFNQIHEIQNQFYANSVGLKYFIYEGSIIGNTRPFCRKRAGKVFSTEETKDWKNDKDLIEKRTKESYNPLIERGRYNCRHFLNYITENLAFSLRPELKKGS